MSVLLPSSMRAAVLTISTSLSEGDGEDRSGPELVRLCEATGRPAEADKWRAERAKYPAAPAPPPAVK